MTISTRNHVRKICTRAKKANVSLNEINSNTKNEILSEVAKKLKKNIKSIIEQNQIDVQKAQEMGIEGSKLDRLILNEERINGMIQSINAIIELDDPVGRILYEKNPGNGLNIKRISCPIGLILAIYESRPNVTSDISALAIKSGNSVILRSGKESINSSNKIASIYQKALKKFDIDENAISCIDNADRSYVKWLLKMDDLIDVVIPRGGKKLIEMVSRETKIAIFKHLDGNCHTYIENEADLTKARRIVLNAKLRRPSICGATESLVIDELIAPKILPNIVDDLSAQDCQIVGDKKAVAIDNRIKLAKKEEFGEEFLDKKISVKIVKNYDEAIEHINEYSSSHTEAIITENSEIAENFFKKIDSAIVMHNSSTQFADGYEFGLGAEVGISTGKLHARGPVGLEQLTTYKYLVEAKCGIRK